MIFSQIEYRYASVRLMLFLNEHTWIGTWICFLTLDLIGVRIILLGWTEWSKESNSIIHTRSDNKK